MGIVRSPAFRISAIVMASVATTYIVMVLLQANHFLEAVLRGHYWHYYQMFIPLFVVLASFGLWFFRKVGKTFLTLVIPVCASYTASLVAFFFLPSRMPAAELFSLRGIDWMFFLSPLLSLSWLYGGGVVLVFWALSRRRPNLVR